VRDKRRDKPCTVGQDVGGIALECFRLLLAVSGKGMFDVTGLDAIEEPDVLRGLSQGRVFCLRNDMGLNPAEAELDAVRRPGDEAQWVSVVVA